MASLLRGGKVSENLKLPKKQVPNNKEHQKVCRWTLLKMNNWHSLEWLQPDQLHAESAGFPQDRQDWACFGAPHADRSSTALFDSTLPRDSGAAGTGSYLHSVFQSEVRYGRGSQEKGPRKEYPTFPNPHSGKWRWSSPEVLLSKGHPWPSTILHWQCRTSHREPPDLFLCPHNLGTQVGHILVPLPSVKSTLKIHSNCF